MVVRAGIDAYALGFAAVTGVLMTSYLGTQIQAVGAPEQTAIVAADAVVYGDALAYLPPVARRATPRRTTRRTAGTA